MGLFDNAEELARKAGLKKLEDKRVAFAQQLDQQGFAPERMLFAQNENGGFTALSRFGGKYWLIISPGFGTDDDFITSTRAFRDQLRADGVSVTYDEQPGGHEWDFWDAQIKKVIDWLPLEEAEQGFGSGAID